MNTRVTEADVVALLSLFEREGIEFWIDGGWGIDALLGRQTREHGDLDVVIDRQEETTTRHVLENAGFYEVNMWFTTPAHTVWHHDDGRAVDLHVVVFNDEGDGVFGDEGVYPAESFTGRGVIGGRDVRCMSVSAQVEFHRGYELRQQDHHDIGSLHAEFGFVLPDEYRP